MVAERNRIRADWETALAAGKVIPAHEQKGTIARIYPWMDPKYVTRDAQTIREIQADFDNNEACEQLGHTACTIAPSTICGGGNNNILGVFAAHDPVEGDVIIIDRSAIGGAFDLANMNCRGCLRRIVNNYSIRV
ncbi:hypothetical protein K402DRAFT_405463 [Aulographum hederae CBS 113979]|uniref:Uncharacterized protein n=1 Tax=Aulographum hederae CBS 113979 TaxID=1176131 RepID=A0A6G1GVZ6_9PEZI|nr:hypothetical protein K402DRAFT_405463 [Aulographum hederae CBS 113979]